MPEMPDVEALARFLSSRLAGATISSCQLGSFTALSTVDPPLSALAGALVQRVSRRGKLLLIEALPPGAGQPGSRPDGHDETAGNDPGGGATLTLAVHLFRAGWVTWRDTVPATTLRPGRGHIVARLATSAGSADFTEAGTQRRLSLWLVRDVRQIEMVASLGPEALTLAGDPDAWHQALRAHPARAKTWLTDQHVLAGIGNGFSDDILLTARLSPFAQTASMPGEACERLRLATAGVLTDAVSALEGVAPSKMKSAKKAGYLAHGREGEACPQCGTAIRSVNYATRSLQYCPACQTGGRPLADRTTSRFVK